MEWGWKKTLGVCIAFVLLVVLPIFLLSNPMMDAYQRKIDRNPNSDFSRWLQLATADACYRTMRAERAADYYRRFLERYREDPRRPYALLRYGMSLEEAGRNADAIAAYEQFLTEYPDRPERADAHAGIERIRYIKPIK
ncbi:MAG TPA: tetratricopeptide repeat protein [Planctomycetota bacterium]|nr:tetratricopeptide repeat protein [Planctomycetota bacterium]